MADDTQKPFLLSDDTPNSYGFKLDMEKLDISRFQSNPVCLYNHTTLVGKWIDIKKEGNKLFAVPEFMDREDETEARRVKSRVEEGYVKGASLGINITQITYADNEPPLVEAEVLECSVVDVPSNRNALRILNADGTEMSVQQIQEKLSAFKTQPSNPNTNTDSMYKLSAIALTTLGLTETAAQPEIEAAIAKQATKITELQTKIDTQNDTRIDTMLSGAVTAGKITVAEVPAYKLQAKENFDFIAGVIEKIPGKQNLSSLATGANADGDDRKDWTFDDWTKKDMVGLKAISVTDPAKYKEITGRK